MLVTIRSQRFNKCFFFIYFFIFFIHFFNCLTPVEDNGF